MDPQFTLVYGDLRCRARDSLPLKGRDEPWYLVRADLRYSDLKEADLRGADLREADLTGVNLLKANLEGADLRGSVMAEAFLMKANLTGSKMQGAIILSDQDEDHYAKEAQGDKIVFLCGVKRNTSLDRWGASKRHTVVCETCLLLKMVEE